MNLPADIYSPDQVSAAMLELTTYQGGLRDASVRAKTSDAKVRLPEGGALLNYLFDALAIDRADSKALDALRQDLETTLARAPVVHITLSSLPGSSIKRQITEWFRAQVSPDVLLTFAMRSDIGGGIVLQAGSRVYDFSFKRQLIANRGRIAEIAGNV